MVLKVRTRGTGTGSFRVSTDENEIGTIALTNSETWCESSAVINIHGTAALYFTYVGSGEVEFLSIRFDTV
ncbi:hypothetical protein D3C85_1535500 [compost metagenome]